MNDIRIKLKMHSIWVMSSIGNEYLYSHRGTELAFGGGEVGDNIIFYLA